MIRIKSDQVLNGNNANDKLTDLAIDLNEDDALITVAVATEALTFSETTASIGGQAISRLGVFANGALEVLVTDEDLTLSQLIGIITGSI